MATFEKAADVDELQPGARKSIVVDDTPALLVRVGNNYYAFEDVCTHDGQPLTNGPISGTTITCPRHGARFDVTTGQALSMPATEPVVTFEVEARADGIYVRSDAR
jgi:3-phenylpropionate/trans-cinnamate dioxygenase ferredoxin subunit